MYSIEQKKQAVKLYVESNFDFGTVYNLIGYPSPNTLRAWYEELKETGELHEHYRKRAVYSEKEIDKAIALYQQNNYSITRTCRELGYPSKTTLAEWVKDLPPKPAKPVTPKRPYFRQEEKEQIVLEWIDSNVPDYVIAANYNISKGTLWKWKKELLFEDGVSVPNSIPDTKNVPSTVEDAKQTIEELQLKVSQLQMEHDALLKANELLKKANGISLKKLPNKDKADVIDALREKYPLNKLLDLFDLAKSSYFYQCETKKKADKYQDLRVRITDIFNENHQCYGYRRIHAVLSSMEIVVSEKVVRRIMKEEGLRVRMKRVRKYNSYKGEFSTPVPNLLKRDFSADKPAMKWLTDITEFALPDGKVYLSPIIDCFDGMVISWQIGTSPSAELANTMLDNAIETLKDGEHPIIHSDRGFHYQWPGWIMRTENAGLIRSMSKKGCSPDNSACEGFFGRLKNEMFYGRFWNDVTVNEFIVILNNYIRWYNEKRIKMSLGGRSPLQYRRDLDLI